MSTEHIENIGPEQNPSADSMIFVFGSNEAGIHGAGAALYAARYRGAKRGIGFGPVGQSFGIPTKDMYLDTLPLRVIQYYVNLFLAYANSNKQLEFQVTQIGCGYAGYTQKQIAPLFELAPSNCLFDLAWKPFLGEAFRYWGKWN